MEYTDKQIEEIKERYLNLGFCVGMVTAFAIIIVSFIIL
jgi:hypothetical protein